MITKEKIASYIKRVPPLPQSLKQTLAYLDEGELVQASKVAKEDKALSAYLKELVNKPIYGFKQEVEDVSQIFGILGLSRSQQAVYSYMISLLSPEKWEFFSLNKRKFYDLQAQLSVDWQKILKHQGIENKEIESAITLLPASIIVSEALFHEKKEEVMMLRGVHEIDLNTILKRLSGMDLFDICALIAKRWEMDTMIIELVQASSGIKPAQNTQSDTLGKWMHLLLFYTLSKPVYIEAGLNDFIEFNIAYVEEVYEEFSSIMEMV